MKPEKKTRNRTPSERAKKAAAYLAVNGGNKYRALIEAGFAHETAKNPDKVFGSKSFAELQAVFLDPTEVMAIHRSGLHAEKVESFIMKDKNGKPKVIKIPMGADHKVRQKYVEMAYKIADKMPRGKEPPAPPGPTINFGDIRNEYK